MKAYSRQVDSPLRPGQDGPRSAGIFNRLRLPLAAALAAASLFLSGFALFAGHVSRLAAPAELRQADAIIVLTGGHSRLDVAVDLLRDGKGRRLLISGVNPIAGADDLRRATGGDAGLFACCVDIDHAATDTVGNATESAKWVSANAFGSVILVTNNYHMPRSLMEMRRYLPSAELQPYPVVNRRLDNGAWLAKPDAVRVMFVEYAKFLAALARGVFAADAPPGAVTVVRAAEPAAE